MNMKFCRVYGVRLIMYWRERCGSLSDGFGYLQK